MGTIALITKELEKILSIYPATSCVFYPYYKMMVDKEIELGKISKEDKVLCIGGGSFPFTALEIAKKTGAEIQIIDVDPTAIKNSKKVIHKLHMEEKIKVCQEWGQNVDASSFTVIHIARQAVPHEEILNNILSRATNGSRILVRSNRNSLTSIYNLLHLPYYCDKYSCKEKNYSMIKSTLLYIKNLGGKKNEKASPIYNRDIVGSNHSLAG